MARDEAFDRGTMPDAHTPQASIHDWLRLIRAEYLEVPDLHLTTQQVETIWGLDTLTTDALLGALVDAGFLRRTHAGSYRRAEDSR
jgi:predicted transcriptional regulator of viral defense system